MLSFQRILNFIKEYPALLSLGTFLIGLYVGNKQAIGRDKRKEFNEISQPAFTELSKQIEQLKVGVQGQSVDDFLLIYSYIPFYKRWLFRKHVNKYKKAQKGLSTYDPKKGTVIINQEKMAQLASAAKALLCYLKRR